MSLSFFTGRLQWFDIDWVKDRFAVSIVYLTSVYALGEIIVNIIVRIVLSVRILWNMSIKIVLINFYVLKPDTSEFGAFLRHSISL